MIERLPAKYPDVNAALKRTQLKILYIEVLPFRKSSPKRGGWGKGMLLPTFTPEIDRTVPQ
jgi:hypothetical protein